MGLDINDDSLMLQEVLLSLVKMRGIIDRARAADIGQMMKQLCDFQAILSKVTTMQDGPRIWLDLQEYEAGIMGTLGELNYGDKFLHIVIYDEDEFMMKVGGK